MLRGKGSVLPATEAPPRFHGKPSSRWGRSQLRSESHRSVAGSVRRGKKLNFRHIFTTMLLLSGFSGFGFCESESGPFSATANSGIAGCERALDETVRREAEAAGLFDVQELDPTIVVDLRMAGTDNILGEAIYEDCRCLLTREVAESVVRANKALASRGLRLKLLECYRPLSVQKLLWRAVPDRRYVADPRSGSRHNRGAAIDVTVVDESGRDLNMGCSPNELSYRAFRWASGLGRYVDDNRNLLEEILEAEGFEGLDSEWWHFDHESWRQYRPMDFPLYGELTQEFSGPEFDRSARRDPSEPPPLYRPVGLPLPAPDAAE